MSYLAAAVLLASCAEARASEHFVIDVLASVPSTDAEWALVPEDDRLMPRQGGWGCSDCAPTPTQPFKIRSLVFDRGAYDIGDEFTYEVTFEYTGTGEFALPSSVAGHRFRRNAPGAKVATIDIVILDDVVGLNVVSVVLLYGAEDAASSLIRLRPADTVTIRATGQWRSGERTRQPLTMEWHTVIPEAHVDVFPDDIPRLPAIGSAGASVQLRQP